MFVKIKTFILLIDLLRTEKPRRGSKKLFLLFFFLFFFFFLSLFSFKNQFDICLN